MTYNMVMKQVNLAEFKTHCSKYLAAVERGEEVIIAKRNVPVARVVPSGSGGRRNKSKFGSMAGTVKILGDIVSPAFDLSDWEMHR